MKCQQPGCSGSISYGYCDVCGLPATTGQQETPTGISRRAQAPAQSAPVRRLAPTQQGPVRRSMPAQQGPARRLAPTQQPAQPSGPVRGPGPAAPAPSRAQQRPLGSQGGVCPQPGCGGTIVDGYCDHCGQPPSPKLLGTTLSSTATSAELATVLLGSALAGKDSGRTPSRSDAYTARSRIGAGITTVPPAPAIDPASAVIADPVVPENRRTCANCEAPVGRGTGSQPGEVSGVCAKCGTSFDFQPSISAGELVANQYEVAGPIAYGGMGWIYLARDRNVSNRWVVLKGLLNSADAEAVKVAEAEQEFLAAVEHPLIVEIYNFVEHRDARYIIMEYVPGRSITQLLKDRMAANSGQHDPLPVDWALAYIIEILPAFKYLHESGLIFCDFKPDNLMQVGDAVKLIDLGAVQSAGDQTSAIFGTLGYQAPEVVEKGVSIASDIYSIGRALAVMATEFKGYQTEYQTSLPPLSKMPVFAANDSFYRLVKRACAPEPTDRFQSAEDMRIQALGVLHETVARRRSGGATTGPVSTLFAPPITVAKGFDWTQLPRLLPDPSDPMADWLAELRVDDAKARMAALEKAPRTTAQVQLAKIELALATGQTRLASSVIQDMLRTDPWDWRAVWMQGVLAVQQNRWHDAVAPFNTVYAQVPGELAPKFVLASACEYSDRPELAEELYALCAATDPNYLTPSAFALARIRRARGDEEGALAAYTLVPPTSRGYQDARAERAKLLMGRGTDLADLSAAWDSIHDAQFDPQTTATLEVQVLDRAIEAAKKSRFSVTQKFGGKPATVRNLRTLQEQAYRNLAKWAPSDDDRREYLAEADAVRKWSLL